MSERDEGAARAAEGHQAPQLDAEAPARLTWYVSMYGEIYGPADVETLARWAAEGRFGCHCWVRATGTTGWIAAESVPELREVLESWPLPLASFRERLLAQLVDSAIMVVPLIISVGMAWQSGVQWPGRFLFFGVGLAGLTTAIFFAISNDCVLVASRGQSLGKIALGLVVVDRRGARPSRDVAVVRCLTKYGALFVAAGMPYCGLLGLIWFPIDGLSMLKHPYSQTHHDRWSNTYVCRLRGGPLGLRQSGQAGHGDPALQ